MFCIRKVPDDVAPANRAAIEQTQAILRRQFPSLPARDIDSIPDQLRDPLAYRFRTILFVAEDARGHVRGCALLRHAPDVGFCFLDVIAVGPGRTGSGLGGLLYERVREEATALEAVGLFFECLPDDPALSPDFEVRKQNMARLRFYERFGARPIANTAYETPLEPGGTNPPYLVLDPLGRTETPSRDMARAVVRAILERKYGALCPKSYVDNVVGSFRDDPVSLRAPRYVRKIAGLRAVAAPSPAHRIPLFVNDRHDIHHVRERGYVEAPVRIRSILTELEVSGLFTRQPARRHGERHIRAVHDGALVDYLGAACRNVAPGQSIYPYVFPIRNAVRPPKERTVRAGYYCIDTFTPLNGNAYLAARGAVDCALSAAEKVVEGERLAYALVRPPGHHAERRAFGGFCYFNNAAIAAHFLSRYGRVAVLDIDYHHGNGTQNIFYERSDVLTVSIHGHPRIAYPYFSGFSDEMGLGAGTGFNVNYPLGETITPEQYRATLARALRRIARFDPVYLVLATGFDTAKADPTGTWSNGAADFEAMGRMIGQAGYPTVVLQEGGYRIRTLGVNVRRFFMGFAIALAAAPPVSVRHTRAAAISGRPAVAWRDHVTRRDIEAVRSLVAQCGVFSTAEVTLAASLVDERVRRGAESDYFFVLAEADNNLAGFTSFGPIAATDGRFDLYWIAVHPDHQHHGLGRALLKRSEAAIAAAGGRRIYVETSTGEAYAAARRLYRARAYRQVAELPDFYKKGDGKAIFLKDLST